MKLTIAVFLCAFGLISAYEFEDEAYTKLIIEQFSYQPVRARRDTQPSCIDQNSCCNDDAIQNYHGNDTDIREQCYKELNFNRANIRGPLTDEQKQQIKCVVECIGKKKGYLNSKGELVKDVLVSQIKDGLKPVAWLEPKLDTLIENCLKIANNAPKVEKQCNDIGLTIGHCIWKEIQLSCPPKQQVDKDKCATLQDYLQQNKRFPPPPPIKC